jgi:hypothetical protein
MLRIAHIDQRIIGREICSTKAKERQFELIPNLRGLYLRYSTAFIASK